MPALELEALFMDSAASIKGTAKSATSTTSSHTWIDYKHFIRVIRKVKRFKISSSFNLLKKLTHRLLNPSMEKGM